MQRILVLSIALATVVVSAGPSFAQVQSARQQACILALNSAGAKLSAAVGKEVAGCISDKAKGKLTPGQSVDQCVEADRKGKVAKAAVKISEAKSKSCFYVTPEAEDLPDFGARSASSVSSGFGGDVLNVGGLFGCTIDAAASLDAATCQTAVVKSLSKLVKAQTKAFQSCTKKGFKSEPPLDSIAELEACVGDDPDGKIAALVTKTSPKVAKACAGVPVLANAFPAACSTATPTSLFGCASAVARCGICRATNEANGLGVDCDAFDDATPNHSCTPPLGCDYTSMTLEVRGRGPDPGNGSETLVERGWTGASHNGDMADGLLVMADLDCPPEGDASDECAITAARLPEGAGPGRCRSNLRERCDNVGGPDAACPSSGQCVIPFGLPTEMRIAGGAPICVLTTLNEGLGGSVNRATGETDLQTSTNMKMYGGLTISTPCASCSGDPEPNDGVRGGFCIGGSFSGEACDAQGAFADGRGASLDCPPSFASGISGTGSNLDLGLSTGVHSLEAQLDCTAVPGSCHCGTCTANTEACNSNADCSGGSCAELSSVACLGNTDCTTVDAGPCRFDGKCDEKFSQLCATNTDCMIPGGDCLASTCEVAATTKPNDCSDGVCSDVGGNHGRCLADAGQPSCFLPTVTATGTADLGAPVLAAVGCYRPTGFSSVNNGAGLPGPIRMTIDTVRKLQ